MTEKKKETEITTMVLNRYNELAKSSEIHVPDNYSAANALKSAYFELENIKDANKKPVLESCSRSSIFKSLMYMVTNGLNPAKKQCYFIPYGGELTCTESYQASKMLAKRYSGVKSVRENVIRKGDVYQTAIESDGRKTLVKHEQPFENLDNEIIGAYCIVIENDGREDLTEMTATQIKKAWMMSPTNGNSKAHKNFDDEMSKRTVIKRACKPYINASDDSALLEEHQQHVHENTINEDYEEVPIAEPLPESEQVNDESSSKEKKPEKKEQNKNSEKTKASKNADEDGKLFNEEEPGY
jgi:recombination protein RecT